MSKIKVVLLALVAVFAMGAITASSASAVEPEFLVLFECKEEVGKGDFLVRLFPTDTPPKGCSELDTTAGEGNFNAIAGTGVPPAAGEEPTFTSTSGVSKLFITGAPGGAFVECQKDENALPEGKITGPKHFLVTIDFLECTLKVLGGGACENAEGGAGAILTKPLKGWLSLVTVGGVEEDGGFFTANAGTIFAEFHCANSIVGEQKIVVLSEEKALYEAGGTFPNGSCIAFKTLPINTLTDLGELEILLNAAGNGQAIKEVTYTVNNVVHKFQCELLTDLNAEAAKASQQEEVTNPDIIFDEAGQIDG
jgi:hypothetical protein